MSRSTVAPFLLLVLLTGPAAAEKLDLTPYFGPVPTVGDLRVFEFSTGNSRNFEVVEVSAWKNGFRYLTEIRPSGRRPILWPMTDVHEDFVIPGKKLLFGDRSRGGSFYDLKRPRTFAKFKVKLGRMNKIRAKATMSSSIENFSGKAESEGGWIFVGLAPLDTPAASYADTAVVKRFLTTSVKSSMTGDVSAEVVERVVWRACDLGEVAFHERSRLYVNGGLHRDTGWIEAWLVGGSLAGQPIP